MDALTAPTLLRVPDAARMLACQRNTIYRMIESGDLTTVPIGADMRIVRQSVDEYVARHLTTSVRTAGKGD